MNYTGGTFPEQLRSGQVSVDFFKLLGAPIIRGRSFTAAEDLPDAERVVVISQRFWESRFNRTEDVIGKSISLSGEPYTVVGVLGDTFDFTEYGPQPQVWYPFQLPPNTTDQGHYFTAAGRLKPGVSLEQAKTRVAASAEEYKRRFPNALGPNGGFSRRSDSRRARQERAAVAVRPRRRRQLRAADRVRQCRQPAAGQGDRPAPRDRDSRGDRWLSRPHHPPAAHRERRPVAGRRRPRNDLRRDWDPGAAAGQYRGAAPHRRSRRRGRRRLACHGVRLPRLAVHRRRVRPDPGPPELEDRSHDHLEGKQRTIGHRLQAEQGTVDPRCHRSSARARAADWLGAADSHRGGPRAREPGLRRDQRPDHADVADRTALPERAGRRADDPERRRAAENAARRGRRQRHLLCAADRRVWPAVHHRRPAGRRAGAVPRWRRVDDGLAALLRGLQDPGETRPHVRDP